MTDTELSASIEILARTKHTEGMIKDIILAMTTHGEYATDGECMDRVWAILEDNGYDLRTVQAQQEAEWEAKMNARPPQEVLDEAMTVFGVAHLDFVYAEGRFMDATKVWDIAQGIFTATSEGATK